MIEDKTDTPSLEEQRALIADGYAETYAACDIHERAYPADGPCPWCERDDARAAKGAWEKLQRQAIRERNEARNVAAAWRDFAINKSGIDMPRDDQEWDELPWRRAIQEGSGS